MGTLYDELNKWLKSPVKEKIKQNLKWQKQFQSKEAGEDHQVAKAVPSAKNMRSEVVQSVNNWDPIGGRPINPDLATLARACAPYLTGQYALDTAQLAGIHVQSLAYRTGHSPFLAPFALRFSPEQAYVDLGRLCPWDQWKVLWTRIGAHYLQDCDYESR